MKVSRDARFDGEVEKEQTLVLVVLRQAPVKIDSSEYQGELVDWIRMRLQGRPFLIH